MYTLEMIAWTLLLLLSAVIIGIAALIPTIFLVACFDRPLSTYRTLVESWFNTVTHELAGANFFGNEERRARSGL